MVARSDSIPCENNLAQERIKRAIDDIDKKQADAKEVLNIKQLQTNLKNVTTRASHYLKAMEKGVHV